MIADGVLVGQPDRSAGHLDDLAPLWRAMQAHQIAVATAGGLNHDLDRGWEIRRSWYHDELAKGGAIVRAHRGDRLVGYCAVSLQPNADETFDSAAMATVITLSVLEEERGSGVGSALLERAEDFARSCGADTLALEVMPGNDRARALYERLGFSAVEVRMHRRID